jgi:hypothetical protein
LPQLITPFNQKFKISTPNSNFKEKKKFQKNLPFSLHQQEKEEGSEIVRHPHPSSSEPKP